MPSLDYRERDLRRAGEDEGMFAPRDDEVDALFVVVSGVAVV